MSTRRLTELTSASGMPECEIRGITMDSRVVEPGFLFVAIPGVSTDGRDFIPQALAQGAAAVISEAYDKPVGVPHIVVKNSRQALSYAAAAFYGAQPEYMAAVTGTDGKTSTAEFFRQLAEASGRRAASIGTLGVLGEGRSELVAGGRTTPDPVRLHAILARLAAGGYTHACLEASSHGLDQFRMDGVKVRAAAFTNLTRDHLDYHGTDEAYFTAKARLFVDLLTADGTAVLNADDARFAVLKSRCEARGIRVWSYGRTGEELCIISTTPLPEGQRAHIRIFGQEHVLTLPHVGTFQVYNMLAALGLLTAFGGDAQTLAALLPTLSGVPGRLERVGLHHGAAIYVDYAHTPAALGNVLQTLRPHTPSRLIVVFGCGGDRDKGKRPQMGAAAAQFADVAIVTDDNPRSEDPSQIRAEILVNAPHAKEIADRRAAIYGAVNMLKPGDVLLLAGKGHEHTQTIGGVDYPFDDANIAREAMRGG